MLCLGHRMIWNQSSQSCMCSPSVSMPMLHGMSLSVSILQGRPDSARSVSCLNLGNYSVPFPSRSHLEAGDRSSAQGLMGKRSHKPALRLASLCPLLPLNPFFHRKPTGHSSQTLSSTGRGSRQEASPPHGSWLPPTPGYRAERRIKVSSQLLPQAARSRATHVQGHQAGL